MPDAIRPSPIAARLRAAAPLVLDGGLATELEARGFDLDDPLWSARLLIEAPEAVRDVHASYVAAGAELVIAATYQATFDGLAARGFTRGEAERLLRLAVELARESQASWVAASVGPYGAALANGAEYTGDYSGMDRAALRAWHAERFALLADTGADLLACETLPNIEEVRALAELAAAAPATDVWFSFSCRDGSTLRDGTPVRAAARACASLPNVVAVGVNCTAPRHVESLIDELRAENEKPIVVYPNSGEDYDPATHGWSGDVDLAALAGCARGWRARGAQAIGGCCRTRPDYVRALASVLRA